MNKNSVVLLISSCLMTGHALAGTMGPIQKTWSWVGSFSAGPDWEDGGKSQTFLLTPDILKTYSADKSSNTLFDGELFLGVQKSLKQNVQGQLGLALRFTSDASLGGQIWDDADPQFNNFTYNYKIQHTHIAVKSKLLADKGYWLIPWLSASIGVGFNNAHGFQNTPTIFEAVATPNFVSHSKTTFTYTLGAGIQKVLNEHWQVGAGYEFADWGQSSLGRAKDQTLNTGLTLNHLYTNGILFNFTYIT